MTRLVLAAALSLACLRASAALATVPTELEKAVRLFDDFEDKKAEAVLFDLLRHAPPPEQAAKAHVYLGLIALNALKSDKAKAEFKLALNLDTTTELPFDAAPKARLTFDQARREVEQDAQTGRAPPAGSASPVVIVGSDAPRAVRPSQAALLEPSAPSVVPALVVGALGGGAIIAGSIFGVLASSSLSSANINPDVGQSTRLAAQAGTQGLAADILWAAGGAAVATGVVMLVLDLTVLRAGDSAVHSDANGFAIAF